MGICRRRLRDVLAHARERGNKARPFAGFPLALASESKVLCIEKGYSECDVRVRRPSVTKRPSLKYTTHNFGRRTCRYYAPLMMIRKGSNGGEEDKGRS